MDVPGVGDRATTQAGNIEQMKTPVAEIRTRNVQVKSEFRQEVVMGVASIPPQPLKIGEMGANSPITGSPYLSNPNTPTMMVNYENIKAAKQVPFRKRWKLAAGGSPSSSLETTRISPDNWTNTAANKSKAPGPSSQLDEKSEIESKSSSGLLFLEPSGSMQNFSGKPPETTEKPNASDSHALKEEEHDHYSHEIRKTQGKEKTAKEEMKEKVAEEDSKGVLNEIKEWDDWADWLPRQGRNQKRKFDEEPVESNSRKKAKTKKKKQTLYCVCRKPYNENDIMIGCDECVEWYHPACIGLSVEEIDRIDNWICPRCISKKESEISSMEVEKTAAFASVPIPKQEETSIIVKTEGNPIVSTQKSSIEGGDVEKFAEPTQKCVNTNCEEFALSNSKFCSEKCGLESVEKRLLEGDLQLTPNLREAAEMYKTAKLMENQASDDVEDKHSQGNVVEPEIVTKSAVEVENSQQKNSEEIVSDSAVNSNEKEQEKVSAEGFEKVIKSEIENSTEEQSVAEFEDLEIISRNETKKLEVESKLAELSNRRIFLADQTKLRESGDVACGFEVNGVSCEKLLSLCTKHKKWVEIGVKEINMEEAMLKRLLSSLLDDILSAKNSISRRRELHNSL